METEKEKLAKQNRIGFMNNIDHIPSISDFIDGLDKAYIQGWNEAMKHADENTSDGYHTFKELYDYRMVYNALLVNELARTGEVEVVKSWRHDTGEECFGGGWFVVYMMLPTGQVSNHYEEKYWDLFRCKEVERAPKWDGHTPQDALERMFKFIPFQDDKIITK